ncbi:hypothetical protein D039_3918B, partial [Vibrio parahaemolyticus EKP-028]
NKTSSKRLNVVDTALPILALYVA